MKTVLFLVFSFLVVLGEAADVNVSNVEQYATIIGWDQYVPPVTINSPYLGVMYGILFLTVTPINLLPNNLTASVYQIDAMLIHNVNYAVSAGVWGADPRGQVADSMLLFTLVPVGKTAVAGDGPFFTSTAVGEDVVVELRRGNLFGVIYSDDIDGGQLRGQIETRNDIFFAPMYAANSTNSSVVELVGASLLRIFDIDLDIPGYSSANGLTPVLDKPVGVDYYVLSQRGFGNDVFGESLLTNLTVFQFGTLPAYDPTINVLFGTDVTLIRRMDLEKVAPVYGPESSNMMLCLQDFVAVNYTRTCVGNFTRLPLLTFSPTDASNNILVYKFE